MYSTRFCSPMKIILTCFFVTRVLVCTAPSLSLSIDFGNVTWDFKPLSVTHCGPSKIVLYRLIH